MVQITGKKNGVVWDAERDCPLATFKDGKFQTEDPVVAEKLESMGYEAEEFPEASDSLSNGKQTKTDVNKKS